jgi:hypothetical protein
MLLEQDGGICCAVLLKLAATPIIGSYIVWHVESVVE